MQLCGAQAGGPDPPFPFLQPGSKGIPGLPTGERQGAVWYVNLYQSVFSPGSLFGLDWNSSLTLVSLF